MTLYENWLVQAYNKDGESLNALWDVYMPLEQNIYEDILTKKPKKIKSTVAKLAKKYKMSPEFICGFLDGINDSLEEPIDLKSLTEESEVVFNIDYLNLFKKMVEYKAEHLYTLPQWEEIFTKEEIKDLIMDQKKSGTYIAEIKVGRNDLCPCGSGKKYKKCHGA